MMVSPAACADMPHICTSLFEMFLHIIYQMMCRMCYGFSWYVLELEVILRGVIFAINEYYVVLKPAYIMEAFI